MTTPPRSAGNRKENKGSATIPYSLPGIICYLQHEWTKMEAERQSWNLQKAEYEAKLSLLDGEIVGLRNLKVALLRRIKMLEYALIQERTKALKLPTSQDTLDILEDINIAPSAPLISTATSQTSYTIRRGKQLIKKFLEEMGNIDDLIDLRCDRMKFSLQERCNEKILRANQQFDIRMSSEEVNTEVELSSLSLSTTKSSASSSLVQHSNKNPEQNGIKEDDSIGGVINEFNFLDDSEFTDEDSTNNWNVNAFDVTDESTSWPENTETVDIKKDNFNSYEVIDGIEYIPNGDLDAVEEARFFDKQIAILSSSDSQKSESITIKVASSQKSPERGFDALTTFYGHLDVVRCAAIHPTAPLLLTASDDHTAKLWDINHVLNHGAPFEIVDCLITLRKHTCSVKSVSFGPKQNWFFTGDVDGKIFMWNITSLNPDDWARKDHLVELTAELRVADAAIVCIESIATMDVLIASCTDHSLQSWFVDKCDSGNIVQSKPIYTCDSGTAIRLLLKPTDPNIIVIAFDSANLAKWNILDGIIEYIETFKLDKETHSMLDAAYLRDCDRYLEMVIGAFDDGKLVWFNLENGDIVQTLLTHDNSVTSVVVLPPLILTSAHDGYVRIWMPDSQHKQYICKQERFVHRHKSDEAISMMCCRSPYFSTAGADGLCRIYILKGFTDLNREIDQKPVL